MTRLAPLVFIAAFACSSPGTPAGGSDADAGARDAGGAQEGAPDGGSSDAGAADAGESDAGYVDAGELDAGEPDAGSASADAGPYLPAGYSPVPFVTATATTHSYAMPDQVLDPTRDYVAVLELDVGRIVVHLLSVDAPITCNSFVFLALRHFYDGIAFHRVIESFMAQGGDPNTLGAPPSTWGTGGPGYQFALEVKPSIDFGAAGVLAMARAASPNTNGSQFFITLVATPHLNQQYTIFGTVLEGLDVLPKIVRGGPQGTTFPASGPTRIRSVHIGSK